MYVYTCYIVFIHSSIDGYRLFHTLAIVNYVTVNTGVQMSHEILISILLDIYQEVGKFLMLSCHNRKFSIVLIEIFGHGMLQTLNIPMTHLVTPKGIWFKLSSCGEQFGSTFAEPVFS